MKDALAIITIVVGALVLLPLVIAGWFRYVEIVRDLFF